MLYQPFQDLNLSALGLGTMRLPLNGEGDSCIDEAAAQEMVDYALEQGVNYFDTAYGYHSGRSEEVVGRALGRHPRNSYYLATKFPGYDLANIDKVESIFEEQIKRCGVEYFDFYLFHNVYEKNVGPYLDRKYRILEYLLEQKQAGRIRHLGFSVHGQYDVMKRFLDAYGKHMEFCQIQLNYLDWDFQDAKAKVQLLNQLHIPIWVMEPLRGGRLASLSQEDTALLQNLRPQETAPGWAFRFLQSIPGVAVVLSGMSNLQQLKENIHIFEERAPLNEKEMAALLSIADRMVKGGILPCTACHYCVAHCPQQLDIPRLLGLYNEHRFTGGGFLAPMAVDALPEDRRPNACVNCGSCAAVCPQQLDIPGALADFSKMLSL